MKPRDHAILAGAMACITLAGCAGGGEASVQVQSTTTVTPGKQLQDLQRALNEGAITQEEYDQIKRILLRRTK